MGKDYLNDIAKMIAISDSERAALTRAEKLSVRNQIVIAIVGAGGSYETVGRIFNLKERQVRNIVDKAYDDALNWYQDLPRRIRIAAFKMNVSDVFQELITLKKIRNGTDDPELKFNMSEKIAHLQIRYDKMLSEGPTLERIREQSETLEKLTITYEKLTGEENAKKAIQVN